MHTEDKAKTKWCPHARITASDGAPPHNRFFSDASCEESLECMCVGSACMAWRWSQPQTRYVPEDSAAALQPQHSPTGYCGLSGRPE